MNNTDTNAKSTKRDGLMHGALAALHPRSWDSLSGTISLSTPACSHSAVIIVCTYSPVPSLHSINHPPPANKIPSLMERSDQIARKKKPLSELIPKISPLIDKTGH